MCFIVAAAAAISVDSLAYNVCYQFMYEIAIVQMQYYCLNQHTHIAIIKLIITKHKKWKYEEAQQEEAT